MNVLVIAPHPDDETINNGATIAHYTARGAEVTVLEALPDFLPAADAEVSKLAARELKKQKEEVIVTTEAALREALREAIGGVKRP